MKSNNVGFYVRFIDKGNSDFPYQFPRMDNLREAVGFLTDFITFVKKHALPYEVELYYLNKNLKTNLLYTYGNENE